MISVDPVSDVERAVAALGEQVVRRNCLGFASLRFFISFLTDNFKTDSIMTKLDSVVNNKLL